MRDLPTRVDRNISDCRGAAAIARQVQREGVVCTEYDAQGWIDCFHNKYKRASGFLQFCKDSVYEPCYIDTPWGRRRHFVVVEDEAVMAAQQREACNFPIQSTVADALSYAMVHLYRERNRLGLKFRIVLAVHDAVLLEVPYDEVNIAKKLLVECFCVKAEVPAIGLRYGADLGLYWRWNVKPTKDELALVA